MTEVGSIHIDATANTADAQRQLEWLRAELTGAGTAAQREAQRVAAFRG